jgi:hypothetical protein
MSRSYRTHAFQSQAVFQLRSKSESLLASASYFFSERFILRFCSRNPEQLVQTVCVKRIDELPIRDLIRTKLSRDTRLKSTLHAVTKQVVCCRPPAGGEQSFRIFEAKLGELLELFPVHVTRVLPIITERFILAIHRFFNR